MRRLAWLLLMALLASPAWANPADEEFFEKEVRPILVARCYECHSAKKAEPAGGLRVDSLEALLQGGDTGAAIKPGSAKESLLIDAVNYGDVYQMPPKTRMPAAEIAVLVKWVDLGAPWPKDPSAPGPAGSVKKFDLAQRKADWWCWQPIQAFSPPPVKDAAWPKQALDRFILARLETAGLPPAPQADKRTLIRRATFTLIGLPPTPAEVEAFVADNSPLAFAKVVDRLLESPHFGERWARHWLDLVRYAESRGHEFEPNIPNAWQYRDYVIRALNADTPYDQFIREQIAGDLLQPPRMHPERGFNESQLGTGFWFLGEEVHSPVDIRKDETDRLDNRLDVMSKTFLGITIACARCHDHKFDAISQRDYYALMGCLISSSYRQAPFESQLHNEQIAAELRALRLQASSGARKRTSRISRPVTLFWQSTATRRHAGSAGRKDAAAGRGKGQRGGQLAQTAAHCGKRSFQPAPYVRAHRRSTCGTKSRFAGRATPQTSCREGNESARESKPDRRFQQSPARRLDARWFCF
jgi:cytochrome c553